MPVDAHFFHPSLFLKIIMNFNIKLLKNLKNLKNKVPNFLVVVLQYTKVLCESGVRGSQLDLRSSGGTSLTPSVLASPTHSRNLSPTFTPPHTPQSRSFSGKRTQVSVHTIYLPAGLWIRIRIQFLSWIRFWAIFYVVFFNNKKLSIRYRDFLLSF